MFNTAQMKKMKKIQGSEDIAIRLNMIQEECAELIVAVNKFRRSKNKTKTLVSLSNEIADVLITSKLLCDILTINISKVIDKKLGKK